MDARLVQSSGIGRYLRQVLAGFRQDPRFRVTLLGDPAALRPHATSDGRVRVVSCGAPVYTLREQLELLHRIPRCDLFFAPHYVTPVLYRGPLAVTIYDLIHLERPDFAPSRFAQVYARAMIRRATRRAAVVLTISEHTKRRLVEVFGASAERIHVVQIGIEPVFFEPVATTLREAIARRHALQAPYVLFVGNAKRHKNLTTLIRAFRGVRDRWSDLELVIVGQTTGIRTNLAEVQRLIQTTGLTGTVRFLGTVSDEELAAIYHGAILFVFPSLAEGFGLPPLEAMAAGVPVLAARTSAIPEACGDAAEYYEPPEDDAALAAAMLRLLSDDGRRRELVVLGRERARLFTPGECARTTLDLLYRA